MIEDAQDDDYDVQTLADRLMVGSVASQESSKMVPCQPMVGQHPWLRTTEEARLQHETELVIECKVKLLDAIGLGLWHAQGDVHERRQGVLALSSQPDGGQSDSLGGRDGQQYIAGPPARADPEEGIAGARQRAQLLSVANALYRDVVRHSRQESSIAAQHVGSQPCLEMLCQLAAVRMSFEMPTEFGRQRPWEHKGLEQLARYM